MAQFTSGFAPVYEDVAKRSRDNVRNSLPHHVQQVLRWEWGRTPSNCVRSQLPEAVKFEFEGDIDGAHGRADWWKKCVLS